MKDRTSHSYRADMPGPSPEMYQIGGTARRDFMQARSNAQANTQSRTQSTRSGEHQMGKADFIRSRSTAQKTLSHSHQR